MESYELVASSSTLGMGYRVALKGFVVELITIRPHNRTALMCIVPARIDLEGEVVKS